ncbi:MAG TPA: hypothetical protein DF774_11425 [Rheinheimera sp.]|uniref:hypothetical protein n=1 Tax=Rheinheimera sp. TaxID=1869214 RepID=UPI000ECFEEC3|nr:hypothetical protein [Rheinheimera sp.]HCU66357.1 hypothetical protein [Rheinheimera sp.]
MYILKELLNPSIYHEIMIARLMREKVNFHQLFASEYWESLQDARANVLSNRDLSRFVGYQPSDDDVMVLEKILHVFKLYCNNQYCFDLKEDFWGNERILRSRLQRLYENESDIQNVVMLVSKLYQDNINGSAM